MAAIGAGEEAAGLAGSLDGGVDGTGRSGGHRQADAAHVLLGQALLQAGPGAAPVQALVDAGPGPAIHHAPDVAAPLVGGGVEHLRVTGLEHHVRHPGVGVHGQDGLPGPAAVGGLVEATVTALLPEGALGRHIDHGAVPGIHQDLGDVFAGPQAQVLPGLAGVQAAVDPVSVAHGALGVVLPAAHPDDVGVPGIHGHTADGVGALLVEDGVPGGATVHGLPEAPAGHAHVPGVVLARVHGDVPHPARGNGGPQGAERQGGQGRGLGGACLRGLGSARLRGLGSANRLGLGKARRPEGQGQGQDREGTERGHGSSSGGQALHGASSQLVVKGHRATDKRIKDHRQDAKTPRKTTDNDWCL